MWLRNFIVAMTTVHFSLVIIDLTHVKPDFYPEKGLIMSCWRSFASDPSDHFLMIVKVLVSAGRMGQFKCLLQGLKWIQKVSRQCLGIFSGEQLILCWPLEHGDVQIFDRIAPELFLHAYQFWWLLVFLRNSRK